MCGHVWNGREKRAPSKQKSRRYRGIRLHIKCAPHCLELELAVTYGIERADHSGDFIGEKTMRRITMLAAGLTMGLAVLAIPAAAAPAGLGNLQSAGVSKLAPEKVHLRSYRHCHRWGCHGGRRYYRGWGGPGIRLYFGTGRRGWGHRHRHHW
jgi:hypothetical protein